MAKYEPLARYLRRQKTAEVELSFRDIERIVGGLLPKASSDPKWWRAEDAPSALPQQRAFAQAGYVPESTHVYTYEGGQTFTFHARIRRNCAK